MYRLGEEAMTGLGHPCFDVAAHGNHARIHLPVAPSCNIACAYCNRKSDCMHESRPGVCSRILTPEQAADRVDEAVRRCPSLAVAGIAGPGDPLADAEATLRTFELIRARHPRLFLCLSTNGLVLARHVRELKRIGVGHVTVTINGMYQSGLICFIRGEPAFQQALWQYRLNTKTGERIMKYGVRNALKATVTNVKEGDVMSQVQCKLLEPGTIASVLTTDSVRELDLKEGDQILLLVKAIHVIPVKE